MTLSLNARAETPVAIVMWIGSIISVLIVIGWIGKNIYPSNIATGTMTEDLENLQLMTSDACNSNFFNRTFNPLTEQGNIIFRNNSICINTTKNNICRDIICSTGFEGSFSLKDIVHLSVLKFENMSMMVSAVE